MYTFAVHTQHFSNGLAGWLAGWRSARLKVQMRSNQSQQLYKRLSTIFYRYHGLRGYSEAMAMAMAMGLPRWAYQSSRKLQLGGLWFHRANEIKMQNLTLTDHPCSASGVIWTTWVGSGRRWGYYTSSPISPASSLITLSNIYTSSSCSSVCSKSFVDACQLPRLPSPKRNQSS